MRYSRHSFAARFSDVVVHVQADPGAPLRSLSPDRAGPSWLRLHQVAAARQVRLHLRQPCRNDCGLHGRNWTKTFRADGVRLWRAGRLPPCAEASRAHYRHHLAERQCLRGRTERGLESDPDVLEIADGRKSRRFAGLSKARDHQVAVHAWRFRRDIDCTGNLHARFRAARACGQ